MSTVVLDGQRAVPSKLRELGFEFRFPRIEAALRDLLGQARRLGKRRRQLRRQGEPERTKRLL
jgi:hypothetical protein